MHTYLHSFLKYKTVKSQCYLCSHRFPCFPPTSYFVQVPSSSCFKSQAWILTSQEPFNHLRGLMQLGGVLCFCMLVGHYLQAVVMCFFSCCQISYSLLPNLNIFLICPSPPFSDIPVLDLYTPYTCPMCTELVYSSVSQVFT